MDYFAHMERRLSGQEDFVPARIGDKHLIRKFADLIGVRTPHVLFRGTLQEMADLDLPDEFVLKPSFASTSIGVFILRKVHNRAFTNLIDQSVVLWDDLISSCEAVADRYSFDVGSAVFIIEEVLRDVDGTTPPQDIRFYAFQGAIGMILKEDHMSGGTTKAMYFDGNFLPFSDVFACYSVADNVKHLEEIVEAKTPANWRELLAVASRVSVAVPTAFSRVDLYNTSNGVVLGEVTFFPGTFYYRDRKLMSQSEADRLGRLWDEAEQRLRGSLGHQ